MRMAVTLLALLGLTLPAAGDLVIRNHRARDLSAWKSQIAAYSKRHYGENTWKLQPTCIVLHYTATTTFPWNLVKSTSFAGERPGLASHYVIEGATVWQILPTDVRSRAAYGINHRAINIEMVASAAGDLARRRGTLLTCAALVARLMAEYSIPLEKVYSHQEVSLMDPARVPEVLDLVNSEPYGKSDPGDANMRTIKKMIRSK